MKLLTSKLVPSTEQQRHRGHGYVKIFAQLTCWVNSLQASLLATAGYVEQREERAKWCSNKMANFSCKISSSSSSRSPVQQQNGQILLQDLHHSCIRSCEMLVLEGPRANKTNYRQLQGVFFLKHPVWSRVLRIKWKFKSADPQVICRTKQNQLIPVASFGWEFSSG